MSYIKLKYIQKIFHNSMLKNMININHSYNDCSMDLAAVIYSFYPVPKNKYRTEIQHGPKYKVQVLWQAQIELWMLSSWLCYHIK